MAKIQGFRVRNFKALKDVTLGRLWNNWRYEPLTDLTAVIGKNGAGKSALFDAFGFLADTLKSGVDEACYARGRGGFGRIRSQGETGPVEFALYCREDGDAQPITYEVAIDADDFGRPYVLRERLRQSRKGKYYDPPLSFLALEAGRGGAWKGEDAGYDIDESETRLDLEALLRSVRAEESSGAEIIELEDRRRLGIAALGALKQHPRISAFRRFIESWHLSYFTPDAARGLPLAGPQPHLNSRGDNLGNVVQFMEREHPQRFGTILQSIAAKIPGIDRIDTEKTSDGRLLLRFHDKGFTDPFYAQQMSDGTLNAFAYLLLLEDPTPPPFLCIEAPENGLHFKLLEALGDEFRKQANRAGGGSQVFVTTHQAYFVNALDPEEVWILEKEADGFATIRLASRDPLVKSLAREGLPLGDLWYSDYLDPM